MNRRMHLWILSLIFIGVCLAPVPAKPAEPVPSQITVKDGWFYVNGEKTFIKGVCFFENHMVNNRFGRSSPEVIDHEFARIKAAGFNAVRSQLTSQEIELANRHGLLVMQAANHLFFSHEYLDPQVIARETATTREVAQYTRPYSNVLYYIVDNEPQLTEGIYRQGETAFYNFQQDLIKAVRAGDPQALVSMASYPPAAFLDYSMYDIVSLNAYPVCPAEKSIGYRGYLRWFKQTHAPERPLIVSEYGWEQERGEAAMDRAILTALDAQVQAGATGSFFYTWRTFGREGKGDNRWLGLIPNQGGPQDYRAPARPLCDKLKTYFEAVVIKPVRTKIYSKSISFEVYGTERTGSMDVMVEGTTVSLNRHGRLWWQGKVPVNPSWKGSVTMQIIARDRRKKTIVKKNLFVHLSPSPAYRLRIINRVRAYHKNDRCQMTIRVEDLNGDARPGMPLRIGVNQTANMWSSTLLHGRTNADGEYQLQFGPLQAGHLTVMATIDQADQDLVEPGVKIVKVSKD